MTDQQKPHASLSRRALLTTSGIGIAAGLMDAAGGAVGNASATTPSSPGPPDVDLMQEHGVLKRVLLIYQECIQRITAMQPTPLDAVHGGAQIIHDFIEGFHEPLEEGYVFPKLQKTGPLKATIDILLVQHAKGRQLTQAILGASRTGSQSTSTLAPAMAAFVRMYQPHEAREDTVVFPAFRSVATPDQLERLAHTFSRLQREQFGPNGFSDYVGRVTEIEQGLGIYELDQFTPTTIP